MNSFKVNKSCVLFFYLFGATTQFGSRPPHYWGF